MTANILLTENIHAEARAHLTGAGLGEVELLGGALSDDELSARIAELMLLGVRSRTAITPEALANAKQLLAIGCFSIGTNHVALEAAERLGIPVFNSPFANSRSVAELAIAATIFLMRRIPEKHASAMRGDWAKTAKGAYEVRGKKLGIVGYGNIGSQLSVIASGLGMHVYYYDIEAKLRHGNARAVDGLDELLEMSDIVTLHVPSTDGTRFMMNAERLAKMKPGAVLINYARGDLVDIDALAAVLESGHLAGAAVDVFPTEPAGASERFESPLQRFDNVILSPHVGGSTQEAQQAIGQEVAEKLSAYVKEGVTTRAVNFPEVALAPLGPGRQRIAHVHRNEPGVLSKLNDAFSASGLNIVGQSLATSATIGYVVTDVEGKAPDDLVERARGVPGTIRVRVLGG